MRAALLLFLLAAPAAADQWPGAQPIDRASPSGRYAVHLDVGTNLGETYGFQGAPKGDFAKATLTGPQGKATVFPLLNPVAPMDALLLDDGSLVTFDNWHNLGYGAVLARYSRDGKVLWSRKLEDLLPKPLLDRVMKSVSSRWWRKMPLEWKTEEDESGQLFGLLTLWNEDRLKITLADGRSEIVPVRDLGEDPQRLLRRGQDLLAQNRSKEAIETLTRAVTLQPDLIDAHRTLADVYRQRHLYPAAIRVLEDAIRQNPPVDVKPAEGAWTPDQRLWLWQALAQTYTEAGRLPEAEKTWQEYLRLDPTNWRPVEALAGQWLDHHRAAEADLLLAQHFSLRSQGHEEGDLRVLDAGRSIGDLYKSKGLPEKAADYYLRVYTGAFDGLLSPPLAEVLETLGRYDEALAVLRQSRDWYAARADIFKDDLAKTEASLERVKKAKEGKTPRVD